MNDYNNEVKKIYADYPELPYISPERNLDQWLKNIEIGNETKVPLRNMERTKEGLLPGDIIMLWRISHGSFTNEAVMPKYFEYDYGIDAHQSLASLIQEDYAYEESSFDSLDHVTATSLKNLLKAKGVKGYSTLSKTEIVEQIKQHFEEKELGEYFSIRGMALTEKGRKALAANPHVIDKHPKKKMYK